MFPNSLPTPGDERIFLVESWSPRKRTKAVSGLQKKKTPAPKGEGNA